MASSGATRPLLVAWMTRVATRMITPSRMPRMPTIRVALGTMVGLQRNAFKHEDTAIRGRVQEIARGTTGSKKSLNLRVLDYAATPLFRGPASPGHPR